MIGIDEYKANPAIREPIKTLCTNIQFIGIDSEIKTLAVTSTVPKEGKSSTALWLSVAMAEAGKRTLLVQNDLRGPQLGIMLKMHPEVGLYKLMKGDITIDEAIVQTHVESLWFLDVENTISVPVEVLSSKQYAALVQTLREKFDFVVFDTPPVGSFIDGAILASLSDATLIVAGCNKVQIEMAKNMVDQLKKANANIIGVVANFCEDQYRSYYYSYHYYGKKRSKKK